jgi:Uma2 family endonuclease
MSITTRPACPPPLLSLAGFRRWTVAEYHKMIESGLLMEGEPVELLEGYLVEKHVRNPPHESSLRRMTNRLPGRLPGGWFLQVQGAVSFPDSEPEPDGAALRGSDTDYDGRIPVAADIGVVIEVSDSSLQFDRCDKGRIYAREGIPVYWVVNVADRQVEVYTDPDPAANPPAYRTRTDHPPGDSVPIVLDGQPAGSIPVSDLIP